MVATDLQAPAPPPAQAPVAMAATRVVMHQLVMPAEVDTLGICFGGQVPVTILLYQCVCVLLVLPTMLEQGMPLKQRVLALTGYTGTLCDSMLLHIRGRHPWASLSVQARLATPRRG